MKKLSVACFAVLVAAVGVSVPVSAGASSSSPVEDGALVSALSDHAGISDDRAAGIIAGQDDFSWLVHDLEQTEVGFAGAAIEPTDTADAWISFVGEPSADAVSRIESAGLKIDVRTDARFTAAELREALSATHAELEAHQGVAGAAGYLDVESQELVFAVWPDGVDSLGQISELAAGVQAKSGGPKVAVTVEAEPAVVDELDGGAHLSNGCTSAFNVKYSGGTGFLTAAHCTNSVAGSTFVREKEVAGVDAQLHKASGVTNRIRYNSGGSTRAITTWAYPQSGTALCIYGATSGYQCSTIYTNDACWPGLGCGFYATNDGVTSGGDSGGPWYSGSTAYGVHKGTMFLWGNKSVFSDMGNVTSQLNVTLCTTTTC